MFFYLSKLGLMLVQPSNVMLLLLLIGTTLLFIERTTRIGRRLLAAGIAMLLLLGLSPLGSILVLPLEQRFPAHPDPGSPAGIIILGGFEVLAISAARHELAVNEAAERLLEGIRLARRLPDAKVVFTGGEASLAPHIGSAAGMVGDYLEASGIARERIVLESASRTTYENALFLAPMLKPKAGERWVLVTSAYHMPRSVGVFRRQGFDIVPWPVDYRTTGSGDALDLADSLAAGLMRVDLAFKEWLGLAAYRISGRTAELWPGPRPQSGR